MVHIDGKTDGKWGTPIIDLLQILQEFFYGKLLRIFYFQSVCDNWKNPQPVEERNFRTGGRVLTGLAFFTQDMT